MMLKGGNMVQLDFFAFVDNWDPEHKFLYQIKRALEILTHPMGEHVFAPCPIAINSANETIYRCLRELNPSADESELRRIRLNLMQEYKNFMW